jgi:hypothetical protein
MDHDAFDRLTGALSTGASRRRVLRLTAAALGLGGAGGGAPQVTARKNKKKQPLQFNRFGCVNVGGKCRGNDAHCCSNVCEGKKPKKGEKDTSRCVAHDASSCLTGQTLEVCGGDEDVLCETSAGAEGTCATTTGNAPFCAAIGGKCFPCKKDADCSGVDDCGPGAACFPCVAFCANSGGTACFGATQVCAA